MKSCKGMRTSEGTYEDMPLCKLFARWWMHVAYMIWGSWDTDSHGIMDVEEIVTFKKGWIDLWLMENGWPSRETHM